MCPHVSKENKCVYFNTNWSIYLIKGCVTHSPVVVFGLCASSSSRVHVGRDLGRFSPDWEPPFRTFQCDNQGRRMDEHHHSATSCTRVFCTSASPHVNELKSAIKDENAGKCPEFSLRCNDSALPASGGSYLSPPVFKPQSGAS